MFATFDPGANFWFQAGKLAAILIAYLCMEISAWTKRRKRRSRPSS